MEAFRKLLTTALQTVPWMREQARRAPVHVHEFATSADLRRLPIMEKDPIRLEPRRFVRDDIPLRQLITHKTSGTTGKSLHIYWSREALPWLVGAA